MTLTVEEIRGAVHKLSPGIKETDESFMAAVVLLHACQVGAVIEKLRKDTGYTRSFMRKLSKNLRAAGVWKDGRTRASGDWFDKGGGVAFWLDVSIALGYVEADGKGVNRVSW